MPPEEQFAELAFPARGIDLSQGFDMQRPGTTPHAENVRLFEPSSLRARGGQRCGLSRWIDAQVNGKHLIQHLAVVVDQRTEALLDGIGPPPPPGGGPPPPWPPPPPGPPPPWPPPGPPPGGGIIPPPWIIPPPSPRPPPSIYPPWWVDPGDCVHHYGRVDVACRNNGRIIRNGGSGSQTNRNTARKPVILSVSPAMGTTLGGDTVTLTGLNLGDTTSALTFGSTVASVVSNNGSTLVTTSPAHDPGDVGIRISVPVQTATTKTTRTTIITTYRDPGPVKGTTTVRRTTQVTLDVTGPNGNYTNVGPLQTRTATVRGTTTTPSTDIQTIKDVGTIKTKIGGVSDITQRDQYDYEDMGSLAFVQAALCNKVLDTSTAFAGNVTVGNLLLLFVASSPTRTFTVTDSQGNVYAQVPQNPTSSGYTMALWYARASASGPCTITYTPNAAGATIGAAIMEYSNPSALPLAASAKNAVTSPPDAWTSTPVTVGATHRLLVGGFFFNGTYGISNPFSPGAGFTSRVQTVHGFSADGNPAHITMGSFVAIDSLNHAVGSVPVTGTILAGFEPGLYLAIAACFKPA